jgi:DNA-binding CsgD family transcriptional regulator
MGEFRLFNEGRLTVFRKSLIFSDASLGFGFFKAWEYLSFFSWGIYYFSIDRQQSLASSHSYSLLCFIATLVIAAVAFGFFSAAICQRSKVLRIIPVIFLEVGLVLVAAGDVNGGQLAALVFYAGTVLNGLGSGLLILWWGVAFSHLSQHEVLAGTIFSFLIMGFLYTAFRNAPFVLMVLIIAGLPLLSYTFLLKVDTSIRPISDNSVLRRSMLTALVKPIVTALVFGTIAGIMRRLLFINNPDALQMYGYLLPAIAVVIVVFIWVGERFTERFSLMRVYRPSILFIAAGVLLLPIIGFESFITYLVFYLGYTLLSLITWSNLARISFGSHVPPLLIYGFGWGALYLGLYLGEFFGVKYGELFGFGSIEAFMPLSVMVSFTIVLTFIFGLHNESRTVAANKIGSKSGTFKQRCDAISQSYKLSTRESEILAYIAQGRSSKKIQDALSLSKNTVNSYISHLYAKLGVHSKEDVIELVDTTIIEL